MREVGNVWEEGQGRGVNFYQVSTREKKKKEGKKSFKSKKKEK